MSALLFYRCIGDQTEWMCIYLFNALYIKSIIGIDFSMWRKSSSYAMVLKTWRPFLITTTCKIPLFSYNLDHSLQMLYFIKVISYTN